jgi:curved DNA-binding protein CbpA
MSYYDILGISKTASKEEIKRVYRSLSLVHHPDKGGDPEKYKKINEAYQTLSDDDKRSQYDNPRPKHPHINLENFFNSFGFNPFAQGFTPSPDTNSSNQAILDLKVDYTPTAEEWLHGKCTIKYTKKCYTKLEKCTGCNGIGMRFQQIQNGFMRIQQQIPCQECSTSGFSKDSDFKTTEETIDLRLYPNIFVYFTENRGHSVEGSSNGKLIVKIDPSRLVEKINITPTWKEWVLGFRNKIVNIDGIEVAELNTGSLLGLTTIPVKYKGIGSLDTTREIDTKGDLTISLDRPELSPEWIEEISPIVNNIPL